MTVNEYRNSIKGKKADVLGLGISNLPLVDFLLESGVHVTARDRKERSDAKEKYEKLEQKGVTVICGENYLENIDGDVIFRSPGIRHDDAQILAATKRGAVLSSEMELFFALCPCEIIAVTGSDGKTTTTTLISEILKADGKRVFLGGNIGTPLLSRVGEMKQGDFAVVELSSFQLQTMRQSPGRCVITNITPNHLNWHTGMEEYTQAKQNIYLHQNTNGLFVTNAACQATKDFKGNGTTSYFSSFEKPDSAVGVYLKNGFITRFDKHGEYPVISTEDIRLPGKHNVENYMAACAVLTDIVSNEAILKVARSFGGVEHRCEFVREFNGVKYYNSSIDSSPTRTAAALSNFKQKVIVILGGYDKNIPYGPLVQPLFNGAKAAVLTGATAQKINDAVTSHPDFKNSGLQLYKEENFENAVKKARSIAQNGDIVILSPAAASFDAFENFEHRGNTFKAIVNDFN